MLRSFSFALLLAGEAVLGFGCVNSSVIVERVEVTMVFRSGNADRKENTPHEKVTRETTVLPSHSSRIGNQNFGVEFELEVEMRGTTTSTAGVVEFLAADRALDIAVGRLEDEAEAAKKAK